MRIHFNPILVQICCHSSFQVLGVLQLFGQTFEQLQVSMRLGFQALLHCEMCLLLDHLHWFLQVFGLPKLLVIDNISAFYWIDRASHTVSRTSNTDQPAVPLSLQRVQRSLAQEITSIGRLFHMSIVMSVFAAVTLQQVMDDGEAKVVWHKEDVLNPALVVSLSCSSDQSHICQCMGYNTMQEIFGFRLDCFQQALGWEYCHSSQDCHFMWYWVEATGWVRW